MEAERRWEDLGIDCLAAIFSKLDIEDLTLSVPFVCKLWLEASIDHQCWKVLDLRHVDIMPWSSFRARFKQAYCTERFSFSCFVKALVDRSHGSTVELSFPCHRFASLQELEYASNCRRLKVLRLPNLFVQEDEQLPGFIPKWKDLVFLAMEKKPSSFVEMIKQISLNCDNFNALQVSAGCIDYDDALAIVNHLPKLKYLVMGGSTLSKSGLLAILDGCKQLEVLNVSSCTGLDADEEILKMANSRVKTFDYGGAKLEEDRTDYCDDDAYWGMGC